MNLPKRNENQGKNAWIDEANMNLWKMPGTVISYVMLWTELDTPFKYD